jgi:hypothetical protein
VAGRADVTQLISRRPRIFRREPGSSMLMGMLATAVSIARNGQDLWIGVSRCLSVAGSFDKISCRRGRRCFTPRARHRA